MRIDTYLNTGFIKKKKSFNIYLNTTLSIDIFFNTAFFN